MESNLKENSVLETFFIHVSQFLCDKAKEIAEKEFRTNIPYHNFLHNFAQAEKNAMSLLFCTGKKLFKKDITLKSMYDTLLADAPKLEAVVLDLSVYICARIVIIGVYEKLCALSSKYIMEIGDILIYVTQTRSQAQTIRDNSLILPLKTSIIYECDILETLVNAQINIQQCLFLPSLRSLHTVQTLLTQWSTSHLREPKRALYSTGPKTQQMSPLYNWLSKFKSLLLSKFALYFHQILSRQAGVNDMKTILGNTSCVDHYHRIVTFHKKVDFICFAIVLNIQGQQKVYVPGYSHPDHPLESPTGLDSYPAIFCYPSEKPIKHWPSLVMMMDKLWDGSTETATFTDSKIQVTYYLCRIEPALMAIAIIDSRKPDMTAFLKELAASLSLNKLFAILR